MKFREAVEVTARHSTLNISQQPIILLDFQAIDKSGFKCLPVVSLPESLRSGPSRIILSGNSIPGQNHPLQENYWRTQAVCPEIRRYINR